MLEHGNIVSLLDVFTEPGLLYMVFPYVDRDLAHHLQDVGKLPKASLLRYSFQLLSALAYCHSRCIVHRGYQAAEHFSRAPNWRSEALWFLLEQTEPSDSHGEVYPESSISLVSRPRNISGRWKQGHIPGRLVNCLRSRRNGKGKAVVFWIIRNRHAISSVWSAWNTIPTQPGRVLQVCLTGRMCSRTSANETYKMCWNWKASIINLLEQMLQCNPFERLSASVLLTHPCFFDINKCPSTVVQRHTSASEKHSEPSFTRAVQRIVEDQSPKKNSFMRKDARQYTRPYSPESFGQRSQKRFKSTSNEADVQNPLSLREEWTRSTQSSSFLSQISL